MTSDNFHLTMRVFCKLFDASISSAHRTVKHNTAVGGAANSQHLGWKACDLVLDDPMLKNELISRLKKMGFFVLDESDHVHTDDRNNVEL